MNNKYSLVPFCTIVSGTGVGATEVTDIELNDTSGNPVNCNYIRVTRSGSRAVGVGSLAGAGVVGLWYVRPDVSYFSGTVDVEDTGIGKTGPGAGAYIAGTTETSLEIRLPKTKLCSKISIGKLFSADQDFAITYGFIEPSSPVEKIAARNLGQ